MDAVDLVLSAQAGAEQRFDWRDQRGFLASPEALGDQELTAFVRVHGIFDPERAAFELKVRGGQHTQDAPALASCTMMTFATTDAPGVSRFGKELNHPEYDFVNLPLRYPAELVADRRRAGLVSGPHATGARASSKRPARNARGQRAASGRAVALTLSAAPWPLVKRGFRSTGEIPKGVGDALREASARAWRARVARHRIIFVRRARR